MRYKPGTQMLNESSPRFRERRARALAAIGKGLLLVPAQPLAIRNNDVEHPYRQHSDFWYLSGFEEPESVLVLSGVKEPAFALLVRERDPEREVWDGPRAGVEGAKEIYGADEAYPIAKIAEVLPKLFENVEHLYYRLGVDRAFDDVVLKAIAAVRARARPYPRVGPPRRSQPCARERGAASATRLTSSIQRRSCTTCACTRNPTK